LRLGTTGAAATRPLRQRWNRCPGPLRRAPHQGSPFHRSVRPCLWGGRSCRRSSAQQVTWPRAAVAGSVRFPQSAVTPRVRRTVSSGRASQRDLGLLTDRAAPSPALPRGDAGTVAGRLFGRATRRGWHLRRRPGSRSRAGVARDRGASSDRQREPLAVFGMSQLVRREAPAPTHSPFMGPLTPGAMRARSASNIA
jgi:hypothetical protein